MLLGMAGPRPLSQATIGIPETPCRCRQHLAAGPGLRGQRDRQPRVHRLPDRRHTGLSLSASLFA